jgi:5-methylcytosine-specific restriction endonuclease McrA
MKALSSRVLVLNATYEPLYFCTGRRALTLVLCGRADPLEESAHVVASSTRLFPLPSVIRLRRSIRWIHRFRVVFNKRNVLKRDGNRCQYCGRVFRELTLDHILPVSRGGRDDWENVVAACRDCNRKKGNRTPDEAGLTLFARPRRPHYLFLFLAQDYRHQESAGIWEKYLPFALKGTTVH